MTLWAIVKDLISILKACKICGGKVLQKNKVIYSRHHHFVTGLADNARQHGPNEAVSTIYNSRVDENTPMTNITATVEEDKLCFFFTTLDIFQVSTT